MSFTIQPGTIADLPTMSQVMLNAVAADIWWTTMKGTMSPEEEYKFTLARLEASLGAGIEAGVSEVWKVVDENGKIVAWGGLGLPHIPSEEEKANLSSFRKYLPPGRNEELWNFFNEVAIPSVANNGYDPAKHFLRQNTMVDPAYQRKGLGKLITKKCNEVADEKGIATYARCRPGMAAMLLKMGYEVAEKITCDLGEYGSHGVTHFYAMRREPGANEDDNARLSWEVLA